VVGADKGIWEVNNQRRRREKRYRLSAKKGRSPLIPAPSPLPLNDDALGTERGERGESPCETSDLDHTPGKEQIYACWKSGNTPPVSDDRKNRKKNRKIGENQKGV